VSHVGALQYAGQHADHIKCPRENHPPRAAPIGVSQLGASVGGEEEEEEEERRRRRRRGGEEEERRGRGEERR